MTSARRWSGLLGAGFILLLAAAGSASALTTLTVTLNSDNNPGGIGQIGDLRYALNAMNLGLNTTPDDYEIVFATPMTIQLNGTLPIVNNSSNPVNITIGNASTASVVTIDGNVGAYRGFFIPMGNVTLRNLILQNMTARGGNGGNGISGGGGGLGAGGAIFAPQSFLNGANPAITLLNVSTSNTSAIGGNGGNYIGLAGTGNEGGGGGGGFDGEGGSILTTGSTGGAGGGGFGGDGGDVTLSTSDVAGGGGGGGGGLGSRASIGTLTNLGHGGGDQAFGQNGSGVGLSITAGAGGGGNGAGSSAGGGGGGGPIGFNPLPGGGGGGSAGTDGLQGQGNIPPREKGDGVLLGGSVVASGGNGGDGGGGGGGAGTGAYDINYRVVGGAGGIGGGGGGGGVNQSGSTPADGGNSLGGGGGAGGGPSSGLAATGGSDTGNLGGGAGGIGASNYGSGFGGGGGGSGSGLGGAIFVDSNVNFTIQALSGIATSVNTANGSTQAGTPGTGGAGATDGSTGSALGDSIFLRAGASLTLSAPAAADRLTLGTGVAFVDDTIFGAGGTTVNVRGDGTVEYDGSTDYEGAVQINNANFKVDGQLDRAPVFVCRNGIQSSQPGTLSGLGVLTGDVFVNTGVIAADPGATLTLGSLTLNPPSVVHSRIDGSGTALVAVTRNASLAGTLEIDIDPALASTPGVHTLLTSAATTGTFDSITFPSGVPAAYSVFYLPNGAPTYVQLNILASADMAASADFPASATAGSTVDGTFACTNTGPSAADAATCAIAGLPGNATVTCSPTVPTAAPLASGSTIACTASYTAPLMGVVIGTVTAGSATADPDTTNDTANFTTTVTPSADMAASVAFPASAAAGSTVNGTFACTNNGPSAADAATCAIAFLPSDATVSCSPTTPAALASGSTIACTASFTAPASGDVTGTAYAGSNTSDPDMGDNSATFTTAAVASADLMATATFPDSAAPGSTVSGAFQCVNNGPSAALAASCMVSGLPASAVVDCAPSVPTALPLPAGSSIQCTATYTAPPSGTITATVTASSTTSDPSGGNSTVSAATVVEGGVVIIQPAQIPWNAAWALLAMVLAMFGGMVVMQRRSG